MYHTKAVTQKKQTQPSKCINYQKKAIQKLIFSYHFPTFLINQTVQNHKFKHNEMKLNTMIWDHWTFRPQCYQTLTFLINQKSHMINFILGTIIWSNFTATKQTHKEKRKKWTQMTRKYRNFNRWRAETAKSRTCPPVLSLSHITETETVCISFSI